MMDMKKWNAGTNRKWAASAALALAATISASEGAGIAAQNSMIVVYGEKQKMAEQSKFYCNIKALTPEERERHKQLTEKLMATRKKTVETPKGVRASVQPGGDDGRGSGGLGGRGEQVLPVF